MASSPFRLSRSIQWQLLAGALLVGAGALSLPPCAGLLSAQVPGKGTFAGKWDGKYENSKGDKGQGVYEFQELGNGQLKAKASWDGQDLELIGERLGPDAMRLKGKLGDTSYRYIGGMENNVLVLHYIAQESKSGTSYFGVSRLTRQKK